MIKKILKRTGIVLLVLIGILFAAPYLFKNQIVALVKKEINKSLNAKVDFTDVDISFFRRFPRVAVALEGLQVVGLDAFKEDTLLSAQKIDAALNIMSVIRGKKMTIYSILVQQPRINAIVLQDGRANWDIVKPDSSTTEAKSEKPFSLQLNRYAIEDGTVLYNDASSNMETRIEHLNHEGSGDFTAEKFTLKTHTTSDAVNVKYGGIPYVANAKASVDADIDIDNRLNTYSYKTDEIQLNDLQLSSQGKISNLAGGGYGMDIQFKSPSSEFKHFLSLVPAIYQHDFDKVKTSGTATLSGTVKGNYTDHSMPGYHINLGVKEGYFKYPDLPKPVEHIGLNLQVDNPDGETDHTVVDLQNGHIEMDRSPFDFRLLLKNPISEMWVDAAAKGRLDLSKLGQLVKLEAGTTMKGLFDADVQVKGKVKDIEQQQYSQFTAMGNAALTDFAYRSKDYPTGIAIDNFQTSFTPAKVDIQQLKGEYLGTRFSGNGQINNLLNYLLQNKALSADLNLSADKIDVNQFMGTSLDTTARGPAAAPFAVPANLDVLVNLTANEVHYDKLDIRQLTGKLRIADESVAMQDVKGQALDGEFGVSGFYSTKDSKSKPVIALQYDVQKVDVQKTFYAFNTFQKLMPIGKYLAGKMSSQLLVNGSMGNNMMPDLNSLTGNGNLLLIEGFLSKFAPLDKVASLLQLKSLEKISLKDVKNYIEFANGKVMVKPFKIKTGPVEMEIGGFQGFNQSIDYLVNLKLPRSMMGTQGNQLVNNLVTQANSKGVPLQIGETVNLNLQVGGTFTNPTVKTDLKKGTEQLADQLKQQATDFVKAKADSAKKAVTSAVKDTIASVKKQAIDVAKEELNRRLQGSSSSDSTKPKVNSGESLKGLVNDLFKRKKKDTTTTRP